MNYTHIVLFPKINELKNVADFRPISLSYVVSRIISSLCQSAKTNLVQCNFQITRCFAPNRLSTDNTTVAFEILHRMQNKRRGKKGQMAIILDISKAYDCVEWRFLRSIMLKLGIDEQWVRLAVETVCIASYSELINGEPRGYITPSWGINQGDPLSLYLFLLCAEGLSSLIRYVVASQKLHGILSCTNGVCISRFLFADDSFIFCQAIEVECQCNQSHTHAIHGNI